MVKNFFVLRDDVVEMHCPWGYVCRDGEIARASNHAIVRIEFRDWVGACEYDWAVSEHWQPRAYAHNATSPWDVVGLEDLVFGDESRWRTRRVRGPSVYKKGYTVVRAERPLSKRSPNHPLNATEAFLDA